MWSLSISRCQLLTYGVERFSQLSAYLWWLLPARKQFDRVRAQPPTVSQMEGSLSAIISSIELLAGAR
jgi:hypothetical protein